jgi:hypothetical protein
LKERKCLKGELKKDRLEINEQYIRNLTVHVLPDSVGKGLEFIPTVRYNRSQTMTDFVKFRNKHKWKYIFTANESRDNRYHAFSLKNR